MVDAPGKRVGRVVLPTVVSGETGFQIEDSLGPRGVDLVLERGANRLARQQVMATEEIQNRLDQPIAARLGRGSILPVINEGQR